MRAINPLNSLWIFRARVFVPLAVFAAALGGAPTLAALAPTAAAISVLAHKPHAQHKHSTAAHAKHAAAKAALTAQAASTTPTALPAKPAEPELPNWPANDKPAPAAIHWDSKGLRIEAANSSLRQILQDVTSTTGVKVDGLDSDVRVFGTYGPGPAKDVLSQLLLGTGYNVLMIGDQGQGTPRQIVLSSRHGGAAQPAAGVAATSDDDDDADDQPEPAPPPTRPGFGHGAQRTPQQITEEMQQRQQEIQQRQMPGQPPSNTQPR